MSDDTDKDMSPLERRRRRSLFRAWHRGTRELDMLLGRYADRHIGKMDDAALDDLEALMNLQEPELMAVLTGQIDPPEGRLNGLISAIREFHEKEPVVTSDPNLRS